MRTLLEITDDVLALDNIIAEQGGDITDCEETIDAWLAELKTDLKGKTDNYLALITEMEARAKARKEQADRMTMLVKRDTDAATYLRYKLRDALATLGIDRMDTPRFKVAVVKNGGKLPVFVDNEEAIPLALRRVIPASVVPDNDAIRKALEDGEEVPGARLGERGTRLSIK